jgi:hypothetical protein
LKELEAKTQAREVELEKKVREEQDAQSVHTSKLQQQISSCVQTPTILHFFRHFSSRACSVLPGTRSYEEELLALQNFQQKRLKLEEALVEANNFIESERARHKQALQVRCYQRVHIRAECDMHQDIERRMIVEKDRMKKEFESRMEVSGCPSTNHFTATDALFARRPAKNY